MCFLSKSRKQFLITSGVRKCLFTKTFEEKFEAEFQILKLYFACFCDQWFGYTWDSSSPNKVCFKVFKYWDWVLDKNARSISRIVGLANTEYVHILPWTRQLRVEVYGRLFLKLAWHIRVGLWISILDASKINQILDFWAEITNQFEGLEFYSLHIPQMSDYKKEKGTIFHI